MKYSTFIIFIHFYSFQTSLSLNRHHNIDKDQQLLLKNASFKYHCDYDANNQSNSWISIFNQETHELNNETSPYLSHSPYESTYFKKIFPFQRFHSFESILTSNITNKHVLIIGNSFLRQTYEALINVYWNHVISLHVYSNNHKKQEIQTFLMNCTRKSCHLNNEYLYHLVLYPNISFYGSFNSYLNENLFKGDGIDEILSFFEVSLQEIDILIVNKGNEVKWYEDVFNLTLPSHHQYHLLYLHNLKSIFQSLHERKYQGLLFIATLDWNSKRDHDMIVSKTLLDHNKIRYLILSQFASYYGQCRWPSCQSQGNLHKCIPGPPFDVARCYVEALLL